MVCSISRWPLAGPVYHVVSTMCTTDQLNSPRKITRPSDNGLMWRWDPNAFGLAPPVKIRQTRHFCVQT